MPTIDFWYEFASTYSYLAAMRIEAAADRAGVAVRWRPFLLGPIFAAQGLETSPFNLYPVKGSNMQRDIERTATAMGLLFLVPDPFPQNSLNAARVALIGHDQGWGVAFSKAVFVAEFEDGRRIAETSVLAEILAELGHEPEAILAAAGTPENKARLRAETEEAMRLTIFGAPTFVTADGELFWGNDRLEQALHWAKHGSLDGFLPSV